MWQNVSEFFTSIFSRFTTTHALIDILDILVVAYLIFKVLEFAVETRAEQLLKGIAIVLLLYGVANWLDMVALKFIMSTVLNIGILAVIILFQPEIRRALEQVGRSKIGDIKVFSKNTVEERVSTETYGVIDEICKAAANLSLTRTGALICLERETKLGEVISTGTNINAEVSSELLENIFFPKAPLHDGAVVISKNHLRSAGCFLPLSQNYEISKELGTRHRAGLGLSEVSDAIVVVVSEETGKISYISNGQLYRGLTPDELRDCLNTDMVHTTAEQTVAARVARVKRGIKRRRQKKEAGKNGGK